MVIRMDIKLINVLDKNKCCGCSSCAQVYAKECITMKMDEEGFQYPFINNDLCWKSYLLLNNIN
ncbi:hypothetical protein [Clostridium sp. SM-530-WT-3G]|uniref:hypothetical protein n=1 Tax=Clostridium sp. SM-530-WT-3G TaxID=2725303 RepID=UPI00145DFB04|nr:hypothetical protein [Clostridium sp. SM-530-WT-3G]NME82444.1 hypothetical protein [Clostridium sp. SM-530-WT-3G]